MKRTTFIGVAVAIVAVLVFALVYNLHWGPAQVEVLEMIEANETAFVVPLEGATESQGKFQSEEFLRDAQVAQKRVTIPTRQHNLGRGLGNFEWIPTARVVKVDRTPITREWTQETETGTSSNDDALKVQSSEPVKFGVGASITAVVLPDDAAKFLYNFGGKSLPEILDQNVRGYVQDRLSYEFGTGTLAECKANKGAIFERVEKQAHDKFVVKGITILYFGSYKGLLYDNSKVQDSIDNEFLQKIARKVEDKREEAQRVRNRTNIQIAEAKREAAEAYHQAEAALKFQTDLDIALMESEAAKIMAERTKGRLPETILPSGNSSNLLLNLPQK